MKRKILFITLGLLVMLTCGAADWLDTNGNHINAHGGGILVHDGRYYWYGEHKSDSTTAALVGVTCYSSDDLKTWTDHGAVLRVTETPGHDLERGCVIERPKVVYNPRTGKFVMWFHLELKDRGYSAARYAVAEADNPLGPFRYLGSDRVNPGILPFTMTDAERDTMRSLDPAEFGEWWTPQWREAVRRGLFLGRDLEGGQMARDQTVFVDDDGRAYHIYSSEENLTLHIAELSDDYARHSGRYIRVAPGEQNEAPTIFKKDGTYRMITSGCTGWAPNAARLYSAPSIWGPWTRHDNPCQGPGADITFGGQGTYILRLPDGGYMFMADIWRPELPSSSTYLWIPVTFSGEGLPELRE